MTSGTPYPNGVLERISEIERRFIRVEEGAAGTITGEHREDLRDLKSDITKFREDIKEELRYFKRAFWSLVASIVGLAVLILQVFAK